MPTIAPTRTAIYIKEAAGYPDGENSKELHTEECEKFCLAEEFKITTRYYDPPGDRRQFDWMMGEATERESKLTTAARGADPRQLTSSRTTHYKQSRERHAVQSDLRWH